MSERTRHTGQEPEASRSQQSELDVLERYLEMRLEDPGISDEERENTRVKLNNLATFYEITHGYIYGILRASRRALEKHKLISSSQYP